MKNRARVVIVGSGICGSSVAYHLTRLGWNDVLVVDQGPLIQGTTSHAPGLVGQLRSSSSLVKLLMHSVELYRSLRVDGQPGFFEVGSLRLASSKERLLELRRQEGFAKVVGLPVEILSAAETCRRFPLLDPQGIEGALWCATDGSARAPILARALADGARAAGAEFHPDVRVTDFELDRGRICAVVTTAGRVEAEIVVCAGGIWSPRIARMAGVTIPLIPMQHQYAMTEPLAELRGIDALPNVRDPDNIVYIRQDGASIVLGGYEHDPAPFDVDQIPVSNNPTIREFDARRFESIERGGAVRFPLLRGAAWQKRVNGLESFTPDGEFILGEAPDVRGFWTACGFCAHGVAGSGGVGKALAEWIVGGEPPYDLWHMDIRRFARHAASRKFVLERSLETYRQYYSIGYPGQERQSARGLRKSSAYERTRELGAAFGEKAGWERPNWFTPNEALASGRGWPEPRGWARRLWSPAIGAEHEAVRERVGLFDATSFSKIELAGLGALEFLERLSTNLMARPVGSVTYTQMLNERGGVECDVTVTRLAVDRFRVITGSAFGAHDMAWIQGHAPSDGSVVLTDVTSSYCTIGLWGPRARQVFESTTSEDVSNAAFPYLTARELTVGDVPALACRVTYVGELGWEIYTPMEYGARIWDVLWEAGRPHGLLAGGYRAIDSLRLEKGYRYWSAELDSEHNPLEAGMRFSVKLDDPAKGDFIGRAALAESRKGTRQRKLACLALADPSVIVLGGEPVADGARVLGRVTSGGYGYTVRRSIAYAYLPVEQAAEGTRLEVHWFGERVPAEIVREPLHDPKNERVKA